MGGIVLIANCQGMRHCLSILHNVKDLEHSLQPDTICQHRHNRNDFDTFLTAVSMVAGSLGSLMPVSLSFTSILNWYVLVGMRLSTVAEVVLAS